jgi:hypothetical protein
MFRFCWEQNPCNGRARFWGEISASLWVLYVGCPQSWGWKWVDVARIPLVWLILCATVHDTFLHNLKPASKDSVFIAVDEWVLSSLCNRLSGPNEGCIPYWVNIMHLLNWAGCCGGNAQDLYSGDARLEPLTARWLCSPKVFSPHSKMPGYIFDQGTNSAFKSSNPPWLNHRAVWQLTAYCDLLTATY